MHKTSIFVKRSIAFETNWCKTLHTTYFSFFFVSLSQTLEYLEYKHWQWYISKPFKVLKSLRNFYTSFSLVKSQLRFNNKEAILKPKIVPKNIFDISPSKFIICLYFSKTHFFQASVVLCAVWALTSTACMWGTLTDRCQSFVTEMSAAFLLSSLGMQTADSDVSWVRWCVGNGIS